MGDGLTGPLEEQTPPQSPSAAAGDQPFLGTGMLTQIIKEEVEAVKQARPNS